MSFTPTAFVGKLRTQQWQSNAQRSQTIQYVKSSRLKLWPMTRRSKSIRRTVQNLISQHNGCSNYAQPQLKTEQVQTWSYLPAYKPTSGIAASYLRQAPLEPAPPHKEHW